MTALKLKDLATEENPMRISSVPTFMQCPGFHICRLAEIDEARQAATNGTAVGRAVELWHKGDTPEAAVDRAIGESPLADQGKVATWFEGYRLDPKNNGQDPVYGEVVPDLQEEEVRIDFDGCFFVGHIDQVREKDGKLYLWDLKASSFGGSQLICSYAMQLCMYTLACTKTFNREVAPGGIIRMTSYGPRSKVDVFYPAQWTYEVCEQMAGETVQAIKDVRRGKIIKRPGSQCSYCPGGGIGSCQQVIDNLLTGRCPTCGEPAKKGRVTCCRPECISNIHKTLSF